ncbi:MAG TPA: hypothetical protein VE623_11010, partial [Acidimicrobiales bacterium]|nr:hypothetical protein [Acidimicrobiales bacterium]
LELGGAASRTFVAAGWSYQLDAVVAEAGLELGRGVALVGDEGLAGAACQQRRVGVEQADGDVAFVDLGVG